MARTREIERFINEIRSRMHRAATTAVQWTNAKRRQVGQHDDDEGDTRGKGFTDGHPTTQHALYVRLFIELEYEYVYTSSVK